MCTSYDETRSYSETNGTKLNHVETGSKVNGREWQNNGPHNKT